MQQIIGLKELKANINAYAKKTQAGHSFIVVKQSKPLFRISSPAIPDFAKEVDLDEVDGKGWETLIDFTKIRKGGVPAVEILKALREINEQDSKKSKEAKS